ncbi:ribosomal protein L28e [Saitoella complicata NRRL Y-17804]|uniref:ribosomal protein L28e n=1 Tax=Saitoella complicata (strain BCRC 22490 / CBS 7301 / JCM 7358 / NBRC 10748 / NRRL Y-17804) TaxID=698492 RepID=UPI000866B8ED|nr:ribosomal protein L28e [Saitoella complicata NRRL Y-17804]ODQ54444.1 ribosomal protein L28e [Saitoella complicata NRRL Y-17804]
MSAPSADLCWEVVRDQSSYLVKRPNLAPMSRDPFALTNFHSYKYSGVNDKAVAVQVAPSGKAIAAAADRRATGVQVTSKIAKHAGFPAKNLQTVVFNKNKSSRTTYKAVATTAAARGYRADLRQAAIARASAILLSQRSKKAAAVSKPRGKAVRA